MPTPRGWTVAVTGVIILVVGTAFGATPLRQLGFALAALVVIATGVVRHGRHELAASRTVNPGRARPGQTVTLDIVLRNEGKGPAPLLLLQDRLPPGVSGSARFALHGIEAAGSRSTSITLRAARRGRYAIGPLEISVVDPFGLARTMSRPSGTSELLVHPRMEALTLPRDIGERQSLATSAVKQPTGARGEDFYTLREYADGDDLRRVHWPSTAKRGRFMIRQEETPWHTRATILLDDRTAAHEVRSGESSFECAVEAAASVVDLYYRSGYGFRLLTAHNQGVAGGRGTDHWNRCLDALSEIEMPRAAPGDDALVLRLTEIEKARSPEAALVLVAGTLSAAEAVAVARCGRRFKQVTVVSFPAHRFAGKDTKARWEAEGQVVDAVKLMKGSQVRTVVLGPEESLAGAWSSLAAGRQRDEGAWGRRPELV